MVLWADLLPADEVEDLRGRLGGIDASVLVISSATGAGLDDLTKAIFRSVGPEAGAPARRRGVRGRARDVPPGGEQGFDIVREGEAFRVNGRGIEMLVARHDLSNLEALAYLESRLREIGVIAALERAGFEPGDEVRIGDEEFELDPG